MPRPTSKTIKDPWDGILEELANQGQRLPVGQGWMTIAELSRKLGKTACAVQSVIKSNRDKFERFNGTVPKNGKLVVRYWWRPIPLANQSKRLKTQGNTL